MGIQLEAGSYATSYIPTTSATVTRLADSCSKTGISSLIGQSEGTLFFDGYCQSNAEIISINRSTTNSVFLYSANNVVRAYVYSDGTGVNLFSSVSCLTRFKAAVAYKSNSIAFYVNGTLIAQRTDTTFTPNITMGDVYINQGGYVSNKEQVNCNQAIVFPTRLTNAELAELTTL
jgi:outer membrane protein assembly factor BamB